VQIAQSRRGNKPEAAACSGNAAGRGSGQVSASAALPRSHANLVEGKTKEIPFEPQLPIPAPVALSGDSGVSLDLNICTASLSCCNLIRALPKQCAPPTIKTCRVPVWRAVSLSSLHLHLWSVLSVKSCKLAVMAPRSYSLDFSVLYTISKWRVDLGIGHAGMVQKISLRVFKLD
jgi:hypothetical protein